MKKLKTLEQFESKDPCQCGGNCGCGGNKSVNEGARIVLVDPNKNQFKKTVFYSGPNRDADAEVEKLNKKLSNSQKQKGFYWKIAAYESLEEAKKYNFKAISKAWEYAYGEDMEDEYEGFYQEVVGKYKNKVTKKDIAKIWNEVYGEDIGAEYSGFFDSIKENLEASEKLEEINKIEEVKADGYSISDDEDERMDIAEQEFYDKALELANDLKAEAYEIGGSFRGPGYEHRLMLQVKDAFKKAKLKLR